MYNVIVFMIVFKDKVTARKCGRGVVNTGCWRLVFVFSHYSSGDNWVLIQTRAYFIFNFKLLIIKTTRSTAINS